MSSVVNIIFYTSCGFCLVWWMSYFTHNVVDVCVVDAVQLFLQILLVSANFLCRGTAAQMRTPSLPFDTLAIGKGELYWCERGVGVLPVWLAGLVRFIPQYSLHTQPIPSPTFLLLLSLQLQLLWHFKFILLSPYKL